MSRVQDAQERLRTRVAHSPAVTTLERLTVQESPGSITQQFYIEGSVRGDGAGDSLHRPDRNALPCPSIAWPMFASLRWVSIPLIRIVTRMLDSRAPQFRLAVWA